MPIVGNLTSYSPPVPLGPVLPDFRFCHADYGTGLRRSDGMYAAGILPQGITPSDYSVNEEPGRYWMNELPFHVSFGGVTITVEVAGPAVIDRISVAPNIIRGMAAFLANSCVGSRGTGGFMTYRLQGLIDYVGNPQADLDALHYPGSTAFVTVTMGKQDSEFSSPGDHDPYMAEVLWRIETIKLNRARGLQEEAEFADRVVRYASLREHMTRLGMVAWWDHYLEENTTALQDRLQVTWQAIGNARDTTNSR